jgi:predicted nucleic acid-binding OB-fold protein
MHAAIADEEWLVVLAVGTTTPFESAQPLVQAVATTSFALVDVIVTDASALNRGDRLYIGPGAWDRVVGIDRQLTYHALSAVVQGVLGPIERIIRRNEDRFIEVFNTTILDDVNGHPLALLPGLSADCREEIIAERSQRRFADFATLTDRVACCEQPCALVAERVLAELREGEKTYRWLTA